MKKFLVSWLIILGLVIFQTSLLAPWFSGHFQMNILLVFLAALAVVFGFPTALFWIILAGATLDVFSYFPLGSHVIIFTLAAYFFSFVSRRLDLGGRGAGILLVIFLMPLATALDFFGTLVLSGASFGWGIFNLKLLSNFSAVAAGNTLLFFLFYALIRKFKKYYSPEPFRLGR